MELLKWADQGHSAEAAEFKCDIALMIAMYMVDCFNFLEKDISQ